MIAVSLYLSLPLMSMGNVNTKKRSFLYKIKKELFIDKFYIYSSLSLQSTPIATIVTFFFFCKQIYHDG